MRRLLQTLMVATLFVVPLAALPALAHEGNPRKVTPVSTTTDSQERRAEIRERIQGKLTELRLANCERRLATIESIMNRAATQGTKHLGVFDKVLQRVTDFYESKGLNVSNYDDLLEATADKQAAAKTAIDAVNDSLEFECTSDNPVGKANLFNGKVRAMHKALKDYRTSIKNLIVGIMGAAKQVEQSEGGEQ